MDLTDLKDIRLIAKISKEIGFENIGYKDALYIITLYKNIVNKLKRDALMKPDEKEFHVHLENAIMLAEINTVFYNKTISFIKVMLREHGFRAYTKHSELIVTIE